MPWLKAQSKRAMELNEFVAQVPNFADFNHPDKIIHFAWFLHVHKGKERFTQAAIRD